MMNGVNNDVQNQQLYAQPTTTQVNEAQQTQEVQETQVDPMLEDGKESSTVTADTIAAGKEENGTTTKQEIRKEMSINDQLKIAQQMQTASLIQAYTSNLNNDDKNDSAYTPIDFTGIMTAQQQADRANVVFSNPNVSKDEMNKNVANYIKTGDINNSGNEEVVVEEELAVDDTTKAAQTVVNPTGDLGASVVDPTIIK